MSPQSGSSATDPLPLPRLTLLLGGARSGKSAFAERLATESGRPVLYTATAPITDEEMRQRIEEHQRQRPASWRTLEVQRGVAARIADTRQPGEVVLLEDVTLLTSNCLLGVDDRALLTGAAHEVEAALNRELDQLCALPGPLIVVSNEVGMGLVPMSPLGRLFRDLLGRANQRLAASAERVVLLVAGVPLVIKGA